MKIGYELELLAASGRTRWSVAESLSRSLQLDVRSIFHRESERWPGTQDGKPFYCLTKGFELSNAKGWQLKVVNDMTILQNLDPHLPPLSEWYHLLADDISTIKLMNSNCDPDSTAEQILEPMARLFATPVSRRNDIYEVHAKQRGLICGAHTFMTDRNRICEVVTAPFESSEHNPLEILIALLQELSCTVPHEAAFHIHFDGEAFQNSRNLLRFIRYFYHWSAVLKTIIPPNPHCVRLGDYNPDIVAYAFNKKNDHKPYEAVREELKALGPRKYCDFNFNNILIADPTKLTVEVRAIPMILNYKALAAASELYEAFINWILNSELNFEPRVLEPTRENTSKLLSLL